MRYNIEVLNNNTKIINNIMQKNITQNNNASGDSSELVQNLVLAMTGSDLSDVLPQQKEEITKDCVNSFVDYVTNFVSIKYSEIDASRLKSSLQFGGDPFTKFEDLKLKFDDAYSSFLTELQAN